MAGDYMTTPEQYAKMTPEQLRLEALVWGCRPGDAAQFGNVLALVALSKQLDVLNLGVTG